MINIILCGGSGTRLWPLSRELYPKQFIPLFSGHSLFQKTVIRNQNLCKTRLIVSNTEQYYLAEDQLRSINSNNYHFLLEGAGRNTGPAIVLACLGLHEDELVLVTPSDHLIKKEDEYEQNVIKAKALAEAGFLVTFGAKPTYPETGYGYIEASGTDVISFKEKPDASVAKQYMEAGHYYWNCGILLGKAGVLLKEMKRCAPEVYHAAKKAFDGTPAKTPKVVSRDDMMSIPDISIDYAVLERSNLVKVIPCDFEWSDLGSFESLYHELPLDTSNNTVDEKHLAVDSEHNLILSDRAVVTIGTHDLIIISTPDALLVSQKGASSKVREVVTRLKAENPRIATVHVTAYRPWGSYTILDEGSRYKIKRIVVKPGGRLSLQKHYHRNEHWVVVNGTAKVTIGDKEKIIRPNESTYIHLGEVHRLENPGKIDLVLIEVQVGDYLEEDDIIRYLDEYNR